MKKLLSALLVCFMLLSCVTVVAYAEAGDDTPILITAAPGGELPFELVPPANVTANWMEGGDSPTTTNIAYSLSNDMTTFFKQLEEANLEGSAEEFFSQYGISDLIITTQVDWAIDDVDDPVSGWHYTKYWDKDPYYGFGYDDEGNMRAGEWDIVDGWVGNATETVNSHWILRWVSEDGFAGNPDTKTPGIKDQLKPDQYTYDPEEGLKIDFTEHTAYFRMRFAVITSKDAEEGVDEQYYYSDWSNIASTGKGAEKFGPLTEKDLTAPVIADLHMTDKEFNDNPVVAFTLTVPDELAGNATKAAAIGGGIVIETEARVKGDEEWTLMGNTDWIVKSGEMECALLTLINDERPNIPKDTPIELRCRYRCYQAELDDIYSDWSEVITFATDDIKSGDDEATDTEAIDDEPVVTIGAEEEKKCPICHFCPQPLGLCIFIWIAIIIVIAVVVIIIIKKSKKKEKENK